MERATDDAIRESAKGARHNGFFIRLSAGDSAILERYANSRELSRGLAAREVLSDALRQWEVGRHG